MLYNKIYRTDGRIKESIQEKIDYVIMGDIATKRLEKARNAILEILHL